MHEMTTMSGHKKEKRTILVVEDEADVLTLVARTLEFEGYHVLRATDGRAGLRLLAESHVDLVLLDLRLPELDGWEVLQQMKNSPQLKAIPVAVLSASASPERQEEAMELGAAAFLIKPVNLDDLIKTVRRVLRGRR
jgi:CheY-like chemotaxis protein